MVPSEICIGCELAGDTNQLATVLSVIGALTGISGAITGVLAFYASQSNFDSTIFREEFDKHRVPLETSLGVIKRHMITMKASAHPLVRIVTVQSNFGAAKRDVLQAIETILSEAEDIDTRGLLKQKWYDGLQPYQGSVERAWDVLDDGQASELLRRQAATIITAELDGLSSNTRLQIEGCVRKTLTKRRWSKK